MPPKPSRQHVARVLRRLGFRSVTPLRKPLLSKVNRAKRLNFARKMASQDWSQVIFSDEKIFRVRPGARVKCWRMASESKFLPKYIMPTVQKAEGLMVWAAMKSSGAISLRRCPPKLNAAGYQDILASAKPFIATRCDSDTLKRLFTSFSYLRARGWRFQQDGAPPHRALTTQAWLRRNRIRLLNSGFWPPMSPDLNPIEHVWPLVLRNLKGAVFSGREQLWTALQEAFAAITPSEIQRLYASMPERLACVRAQKGGPTRY